MKTSTHWQLLSLRYLHVNDGRSGHPGHGTGDGGDKSVGVQRGGRVGRGINPVYHLLIKSYVMKREFQVNYDVKEHKNNYSICGRF